MASSKPLSKAKVGTSSRRDGQERRPSGKHGLGRRTLSQERDRLAQLLHDTVCQELTGICFMASAAARQHGATDALAGKRFEEIADEIQRTGKHLAKIVRGLRDPA